MSTTLQQYNQVIAHCFDLFMKKHKDYGTSWRVLRTISITDQIYIKAQRVRTLQETQVQKVEDDIYDEFVGIINYCIIALIQLKLNHAIVEELSANETELLYQQASEQCRQTMLNKNHDYGEAWRNMSEEGITDLILVKLQRVRQIISNKGKTIVSEGLDANFIDMLNYAVFVLILSNKFNHE